VKDLEKSVEKVWLACELYRLAKIKDSSTQVTTPQTAQKIDTSANREVM
jgi:hypothetical protein